MKWGIRCISNRDEIVQLGGLPEMARVVQLGELLPERFDCEREATARVSELEGDSANGKFAVWRF